MTQFIDLLPEDMAILRDVLRAHLPPATNVWVFGSRATGNARRYSDIDLALRAKAELGWALLGQLTDALSESDLTIKVDLVDLHAVDPAFRQRIAEQMVPLSLSVEGP